MNTLRIATRSSPLALWQASWVADALQKHHPKLKIELTPFTTSGDKAFLPPPLGGWGASTPKGGGKGLFTKELENALFQHKADIAVHSIKDLPTELPTGLMLAATCTREDPRDVFVSVNPTPLEQCKTIGTSSIRRTCQLKAAQSDIIILPLRGNVGTRLQKLENGEYDGIVLAYAGLKRLGLTQKYHVEPLLLLPAPGQGAIGIECRADDKATQILLKPLNDKDTEAAVLAERTMSHYLGGNCQVPVAGLATTQNNQLLLKGLVGSRDGKTIIRAEKTGQEAIELGKAVAQALLQQGAAKLLCQP